MLTDELEDILIKELNECESIRNIKIPMCMIVDIYNKVHSDYFLNYIRDYIWFNEVNTNL